MMGLIEYDTGPVNGMKRGHHFLLSRHTNGAICRNYNFGIFQISRTHNLLMVAVVNEGLVTGSAGNLNIPLADESRRDNN